MTALALSLAACGSMDREVAKLKGHAKVCVEGVQYLQFPSGVTVQVDQEGKPVKC